MYSLHVYFVSFRFVSFRFVSFRFVSFRFVSFRLISIMLCKEGRVYTTGYANYCGLFSLPTPVNFPCVRKPEYQDKTHNFQQSIDFYSFHMSTRFKSHWEGPHENRTCKLRGEKQVRSSPPKPPYVCIHVQYHTIWLPLISLHLMT